MHSDGDWQAVEGMLTKDMATASEYFQTWKPKLSTTKMVSVDFHLNNIEAKPELKVKYNNKTLPFCSDPKYFAPPLGSKLLVAKATCGAFECKAVDRRMLPSAKRKIFCLEI